MRVHVVSDVHGRVDALARAGDGADALICLGDLVLFMDYDDHGDGIMGTLFGAAAVGEFIALRTAQRFDEARDYSRSLWATLDGDPRSVLEGLVREQYRAMFAAFPDPTYLTFGNVDVPAMYGEFMKPGVHLLDGQVTEIAGLRFGFVGGGLKTPMHTPYEITDDEYAEKVAAIGTVDVLCSHIPPHLPELTYDTEARRYERGSVALLEAIQATQPAYALFGHVHQPWTSAMQIGRTRCVNVGHFRARQLPFALEL